MNRFKSPAEVEEMSIPLINKTIQDYADAAGRCKDSGFKMVMIHGAHGMLPSQFLSPYVNKRVERYGGSFENRARFCIELLEAVRSRSRVYEKSGSRKRRRYTSMCAL
ncbi:oxidoreductase [Clostridium sp.]|uniref:oxidoreductase n=1 Tax=Clostridium sp. TaxID=1506 RepID=UPI0026119C14|nr:hypothetical protein [uncultured Clostridium sp.]